MSNYGAPKGNKNHFKHGLSHTRLDNIYKTMKARCYVPTCNKYERYGARGISMCDEWLADKTSFFTWAINNGYSPELSIDRIDNNGNYEPANCRWVTSRTQQNNKSSNVMVDLNGKHYTLAELCRELHINYKYFWKKYRSEGLSLEEALKCCEVKYGKITT